MCGPFRKGKYGCLYQANEKSRSIVSVGINGTVVRNVRKLEIMSLSFLNSYNEEQLSHFFSLRGADEKATLEFWKRNLRQYCLENGKFCFTIDDVISSFTVDGLVPGYFDKSLVHLLKEKSVIDKEELKKESNVNLVTYMFSSLWSSVFENSLDLSSKSLFSASILNEIESHIVKHANALNIKERAFLRFPIQGFKYNFQCFLEEAMEQISDLSIRPLWSSWVKQISAEELDTLLSALARNKVVIFDDKVIKVLGHIERNLPSNEIEIQAAAAFLDVRKTLHSIAKRIAELQEQSQKYTKSAISAKSRSDVSSALMFLKLKKNTESTLQRLLQAQYNLEECLQTMEGSEINELVVNAYSSASKALKSVRTHNNITVESVESAMEMFQEEMDQMQEIGDTLLSSASATMTEDERDELQLELDAILNEESKPVNSAELLASSMPNVPNTSVTYNPTTVAQSSGHESQKFAVPS